eukprot:m.711623 g.711623  ORF g.711623 m.711623 type:complete len:117 (+) comp58773_c0_seq4:2316-2666(+)
MSQVLDQFSLPQLAELFLATSSARTRALFAFLGSQQTGFRLALIPGEEYVAVVADARGENLVVTAKEVRIGVSRQSVPAAMRAGLRRGQEVRVLFEGRDQNGRLAARILEPASSRS